MFDARPRFTVLCLAGVAALAPCQRREATLYHLWLCLNIRLWHNVFVHQSFTCNPAYQLRRPLAVRNLPCVVPEIKLRQIAMQVLCTDVVIGSVDTPLEE